MPPSTPSASTTVGIVLAGGASSRMGFDKRTARLAGVPLLSIVAARLAPQVAELAVSLDRRAAAALSAWPTDPAIAGLAAAMPKGATVLADAVDDREGPLAGLLAGLSWATERGADRLVATPVDTPFLPSDLVARLSEAVGPDEVAVARTFGRRHPATALIPAALAADLAAFLATGVDRKVGAWLARHPVRDVDLPPVSVAGQLVDPLANINTPADLAEAEAVAAALASGP